MKPIPWSYTHLNNSRNCPHKFAEVTVHKRVKDDGEHNAWGQWAHKQIEDNIKAKGAIPWHENMVPYVPHIERALEWAGEGKRFVELGMGLSTKLEPVNFFADNIWGRCKLDLIVVNNEAGEAYAIDWKFGKMKPDLTQLRLFAIFVFYHFPRVAKVHTSFEWMQDNQHTREMFVLTDLQDLWRQFLPALTEFKRLFAEGTFPKRPSGLCRGYCPVQSCEHWAPKR